MIETTEFNAPVTYVQLQDEAVFALPQRPVHTHYIMAGPDAAVCDSPFGRCSVEMGYYQPVRTLKRVYILSHDGASLRYGSLTRALQALQQYEDATSLGGFVQEFQQDSVGNLLCSGDTYFTPIKRSAK